MRLSIDEMHPPDGAVTTDDRWRMATFDFGPGQSNAQVLTSPVGPAIDKKADTDKVRQTGRIGQTRRW